MNSLTLTTVTLSSPNPNRKTSSNPNPKTSSNPNPNLNFNPNPNPKAPRVGREDQTPNDPMWSNVLSSGTYPCDQHVGAIGLPVCTT